MQTESLFLDIHLKETDNEDAAQVEIKYISIDSDNDVIGTIVDVLMFVPALGQYITVLDRLMNDDASRGVWNKIGDEFNRHCQWMIESRAEAIADGNYERYIDMKEEY